MNLAIILIAGRGSRLRPLTDRNPKCLIKIGDLPILGIQLTALRKNGIKNIVLVVGYMAEKIKKYVFGNFPDLNIIFVYNTNPHTNTLYSLFLASEKIKHYYESIFLLNGDVFFDSRIIKNLKDTNQNKSYISIQMKKCGEEEIKAILAKDGSVKFLNKEENHEKAVGEAIGINKFSVYFWKDLTKELKHLKDEFSKEYFEYAIEKVINKGKKIFPFDIGDLNAIEIDFPKDLEVARKFIFSVAHKKGKMNQKILEKKPDKG